MWLRHRHRFVWALYIGAGSRIHSNQCTGLLRRACFMCVIRQDTMREAFARPQLHRATARPPWLDSAVPATTPSMASCLAGERQRSPAASVLSQQYCRLDAPRTMSAPVPDRNSIMLAAFVSSRVYFASLPVCDWMSTANRFY
jgi:hypothetical protein